MAAATPDRADRAPDNAEQLRRRANRRLLGASILLLVAIIAVPMFLEREPPPLPDNVDVRIPPVEGTKFEPRLADGKKAAAEKPAEIAAINEPVGAQAGATVAPAAAPTAAPAAATPAPVTPPAASVAPAKPAEAPKAAVKEPPKAAARETPKEPPKAATKEPARTAEAPRKPGQLAVQVIAVRDPATAKSLYDKAKALKFPVYTEKIDVSNGVVTRVRVGPYDSKQQAEAARAKLAQAGFEAKVVTLQ